MIPQSSPVHLTVFSISLVYIFNCAYIYIHLIFLDTCKIFTHTQTYPPTIIYIKNIRLKSFKCIMNVSNMFHNYMCHKCKPIYCIHITFIKLLHLNVSQIFIARNWFPGSRRLPHCETAARETWKQRASCCFYASGQVMASHFWCEMLKPSETMCFLGVPYSNVL